jgi:hypothetical protein
MKRSFIVVGAALAGLVMGIAPARAQRTPMIVRDIPMVLGQYFLPNPEFVEASKATFLRDEDMVIGVAGNGVAKAYPASMTIWHHAVQDQLGELPIFVTF